MKRQRQTRGFALDFRVTLDELRALGQLVLIGAKTFEVNSTEFTACERLQKACWRAAKRGK